LGSSSGKVSGTLANTISTEIRNDILAGVLESGEPLRQGALAKRFNTSRVPVREALRQLEVEGLVTFHALRGAVVSTIEPADVLEMFDIRVALETYMLRLAVPNMIDQHFQDAQAVIDQENVDKNAEEWDELNWQFHYAIYLPAYRPKMLNLVKSNYFNSARFVRMKIAQATGREKPHSEHIEILEACKQGDVEKAVSLLTTHLEHTKKSLETAIYKERTGG